MNIAARSARELTNPGYTRPKRSYLTGETARAAAILVVILNVLFFPFIWGERSMLDSAQLCPSILPNGAWSSQRVFLRWSKTLDGAAAAWFFEPSLAVVGNEYTADKMVPLWNPYQAYGTPLAADMQSQPFYPLTILLSLHLTPYTYNLYILARLFIAGLFTCLFLRFFVSFVPALGGGIAAMLSGYLIFYMTMPHLSVEVLIPAALYTGELLLRRRSYGSFLAFVFVLFLLIVGGMPESTLLGIIFVYLYLACRIVSDAQFRGSWMKLSRRVFVASAAGLGLSLILILPFLEFMRNSYNTHDPRLNAHIPGLYHLASNATAFTLLLPLIDGQWNGLTNDFGIVAFFLVLVASMSIFRRDESSSGLRALTIFALAFAVVVALKIYGLAPVQAVGKLPVFSYVDFYKYAEPLLSFSVAILCAAALEQLTRGVVTRSKIGVALALSWIMIPLAFLCCRRFTAMQLQAGRTAPQFAAVAVMTAASALLCLTISLFSFEKKPKLLGLAITVILGLELSLNYIPALYYVYNSVPTRSENPFAGAPYLRFLKEHMTGYDRIFARDRVLYPDWASVFRLADIRDLDAMYYRKYLPFVRNFITPGDAAKTQELWNRFTGEDGSFDFKTPLEKRLLQLSSVRYVISARAYSDSPFQQVYSQEVRIYRYEDVLPRASLFSSAELDPDEAAVLKRLADPAVDIFHTVLLDRTKLSQDQLTRITAINRLAAKQAGSAEIVSYQPGAVEIRASLTQPGILMLNDADYPGWTVSVNGHRGEWFTANYLFRGVLLTTGNHVVKFVYRPKQFYVGASAAALVLLSLLVTGLLKWRRPSIFQRRRNGTS